MSRSNSLTAKLALATLMSSACALVPKPRGEAFSVDTFAAPAPQQFDPTAELRTLWSKYPATGRIDKRQADLVAQEGSAIVYSVNSGLSYLVPTVIGNQTFRMIYDTGSADLWVYSNVTSPVQDSDKTFYFPSSSAELLANYTWTIKYGGGATANGIVYTDVVKAGPVTAEKQAVESALEVPIQVNSDGILGLAFSTINQVKPVKQTTFFETVAPTLQRKVFAANLRAEGNGTWDFGYIDKSKYTGDMMYAPVVDNPRKHWTIDVKGFAVGNDSFGSTAVGNVIVDSGTSLVYLPQAVLDGYYSQIQGFQKSSTGFYTFPCNATLPDLNLKIGEGQYITFPGRDINYSKADIVLDRCAGSIYPNLNMRYAILGNLFMKNYYVVHSMEESTPKIGFALH